jgi:hypothetical protein
MFIGFAPNSLLASRRSAHEAAVNRIEDDSIARYRAMKAMAGPVEEAIRRAEGMIRLELSLGLVPVRSAVVAAPPPPRWS